MSYYDYTVTILVGKPCKDVHYHSCIGNIKVTCRLISKNKSSTRSKASCNCNSLMLTARKI